MPEHLENISYMVHLPADPYFTSQASIQTYIQLYVGLTVTPLTT